MGDQAVYNAFQKGEIAFCGGGGFFEIPDWNVEVIGERRQKVPSPCLYGTGRGDSFERYQQHYGPMEKIFDEMIERTLRLRKQSSRSDSSEL